MVNKHHNQRQNEAILANVSKEMDLPRLSASVAAGTTRKLPSRLNDTSEKMKKRGLLETSELSADMIRPTPLIRLKVKVARKKPGK
jgi:hypothetical protein